MRKKAKIISIAGGKGGVGKTFLASNLAVAMAEYGKKVVLIDLDFGGANLHTFLGLRNNNPGIGAFVNRKQSVLSEFLVNTGNENLKFIPGDGITPFMANISFLQKHRIIKNIENLEADYIILDLGAGATYNTLDFFNIGDRGVIVTRPDFLSVISALAFMKNIVFRKIERAFSKEEKIKKKLKEIFRRPIEDNSVNIISIMSEIEEIKKNLSSIIKNICNKTRPAIIFNMGKEISDMDIMKQFDTGLSNVLAVEADYFGFILSNTDVLKSVQARKVFMDYDGESKTAVEIRQIAKRLIKYIDEPILNSGDLLKESTKKFIEE